MGVYNSKSGEYAVFRIIGPMQHDMDSAIGELWSIGTGYAIHNCNIWHGICYCDILNMAWDMLYWRALGNLDARRNQDCRA